MIKECQVCGKHVKECGRLLRVVINGVVFMLCKECRRHAKNDKNWVLKNVKA